MREMAQNREGTSKFLLQVGHLIVTMVTVGFGSFLNGIGLMMDSLFAARPQSGASNAPTQRVSVAGDDETRAASRAASGANGSRKGASATAADPVSLVNDVARSVNATATSAEGADSRVDPNR